MNFYYVMAIICASILVLGCILFSYKIHFWKYAFRKQTECPDSPQDKKYAILIPARDESKIIKDTLDSISKQTYNKQNLSVFVIVEDKDDPTIEICKNYKNVTSYVLPYAPGSKGGALSLAIKHIYASGARFDGYFVIDADNCMHEEFVEKMHNAFCAGNDVVLGAKRVKHPTAQWVSCGNALTMTFINSMNNKCRSEHGQNVVLQGTPLLINKTIIEDAWGGDWPLQTLAEDYELSIFCATHNFKSYYCEFAKSYYETPTSYVQSSKQRLRWVKGHNAVDFKYAKEIRHSKCKYNTGIYKFDTVFSLVPIILMIVSAFAFLLFSIIYTIVLACLSDPFWLTAFFGSLLTFVLIYIGLALWGLFGLLADKNVSGLSKKQIAGAFFTVPIFFMSWVPVYFKSFFIKNVKWTKIKCD